ncbi:hypothetical protein GCM10011390_26730 [Aureimonas endophytica]|uniref:Uncharacterized protein n=2 Tax=Aureimonas endophytica TaxID=2027858 RepID=A0A916ZNL8_9HYPH|nr:hypothetical protein GCM10011390_26730 [Aureimonas endophytica]
MPLPGWAAAFPRTDIDAMTPFNLFRKTTEIRVHCAVPDGGALPSFLIGPEWSFEGKITDLVDRILDTDKPLYESVVRETGYFLFSVP